MKKLFFVLLGILGLLSCVPASAEWVPYYQGAETEEFFDPQLISQEKGLLKLWTLTTYAAPITSLEGQELQSEKTLTTVDCPARKTGAEKVIKLTGKNGDGMVVATMDTVLRLGRVRAGSADDQLLGKICR